MIIKHYYSNIIPFCVVQTAYAKSEYLKILNTKEKVYLKGVKLDSLNFGRFLTVNKKLGN